MLSVPGVIDKNRAKREASPGFTHNWQTLITETQHETSLFVRNQAIPFFRLNEWDKFVADQEEKKLIAKKGYSGRKFKNKTKRIGYEEEMV